jgi:4-hydroxy-3-polyprenylbenzoate decarboxylase
VAVALGGDPVYAYSATAPLPENVDEYMLAGFLRKKKVELVKCLTQPDIEVPADADFIIEGYVDPSDELVWEGPFGDHTGYYSLPDWYPRFHITAITHKKNPVYPATIVGIPPQEDAWLGKATERIFLAPMKMTMIPEIVDMDMPVEGVFHNLVIAQIRKEYAGQGQKVMNAMWGAGQMMFNKILVIADEGVRIQDYEDLARYVFANLDVVNDVAFGTGPMDVLDHSCSKLGFGGKLCIDGTKKFGEETDDRSVLTLRSFDGLRAGMALGDMRELTASQFTSAFPEIKSVNVSLLKKEIPCLIVSVEKQRPDHVRELHQALVTSIAGMEAIKMILYVEHTVDANDLPVALWRFCNNLDPKRDSLLVQQASPTEPGKRMACLGLDGTRKTKELDGFHRDWPNIIVAADATIVAVDKKWPELGLGKFIPSPSLKFKHQVYGEEAVVS